MNLMGRSSIRRAIWAVLPTICAVAAGANAATSGNGGPNSAPPKINHPIAPATVFAPVAHASNIPASGLKSAVPTDFGFMGRRSYTINARDSAPVRQAAIVKRRAIAADAPAAGDSTGITLDDTLNVANAGPLAPVNGVYLITASSGVQSLGGGNLFFSFSSFNLGQGQTAMFAPAVVMPKPAVQNVLIRVTGASPSNIDGTLQCTIPNAGFYFLNPHGVIFGPDASVSVPASLTITTADYLRLGAGGNGLFSATSPTLSVLTAGTPSSFGFVPGAAPAAITVNGQTSDLADGTSVFQPKLNAAAGAALTVVCGDITLTGGQLAAVGSGSATIASVASAGEAKLPASGSGSLDLTSFSQLGAVTVSGGAFLGCEASTGNSGALNLYARSLIVTSGYRDPAGIFLPSNLASRADSGASGAATLVIAGPTTVSGGGFVGSDAFGGNSGPLSLSTVDLTITGSNGTGVYPTEVASRTEGIQGGSVTISATGSVTVGTTAFLGSDALAPFGVIFGTGLTSGFNSGPLSITAGAITDTSLIESRAGTGDSGAVNVQVTGAVVVGRGGVLTSDTSSGGGNNSGKLTLSAASLSSGGLVGSVAGLGSGGSVTLSIAGPVTVQTLGYIGSSSSGANAGSLNLKCTTLTAGGGTAGGSPPAIGSQSSNGNAGGVTITASSAVTLGSGVFLGSNADIAAPNNPMVETDAGQVTISAASLTLNGATVGSRAGTGHAGSVTISATGAVNLTGGFVGADASSGADAGLTQISAGQISIDGAKIANLSNDGDAGVFVTANALSLTNGGSVFSRTEGGGPGGDVQINAAQIVLDGRGADGVATCIYTLAYGDVGNAPGGNVLVVGNLLKAYGLASIGSGSFGYGASGNVSVQVKSIVNDVQQSAHVSVVDPGGQTVALTGPSYGTPVNEGVSRGGNFFETFASLNLAPYESLFLSIPTTATSVFVKVNGSAGTNIDGVLFINSANTGFYLVSPGGISFGRDAAIFSASTPFAPGALTLTTADYLILGQSGRFDATNPAQSNLTADAPTAFGFSSAAPAAITIDGQTSADVYGNPQFTPSLNPAAGGSLTVIGGDITIGGGELAAISGGWATFISVGSAGQAVLSGASSSKLPDTHTFTRMGNIAVTGGAFLGSDSYFAQDAGALHIVCQNLSVSGNDPRDNFGSEIASRSGSNGQAAEATILASGSVTVSGGGILSSDASFGTDAGPLSISAASLTVAGGRTNSSDDFAPSQLISRCGASGQAGSVTLDITGALIVSGGAFLGSDGLAETPSSVGNGGTMNINVGSLSVFGSATDIFGDITFSQLASRSANGQAGAVTISSAGPVTVREDALLGPYSINGGAGTLQLTAASLTIDTLGEVASQGATNAGALTIAISGAVSVSGGGALASEGLNTGSFTLSSASLSVAGTDGFSNASSVGSLARGGQAGSVSINCVGLVSVTGGATVESFSPAGGTAGTLAMTASNILVDGQGILGPSSIAVSGSLAAMSTATMPDLSIAATNALAVSNGAYVTADSFSAARAGTVMISAPALTIASGGAITARSFAGGPAGSLTVDATHLQMDDAILSASIYQGGSQGGNVSINSSSIVMTNGSIISATTGGGLVQPVSVSINFDSASVSMPATVALISPLGTRIVLDTVANSQTYADAGPDVPFDFLSRLTAGDLDGTWKLQVISTPNSAVGNTISPVIFDGWSLNLGGQTIGVSGGASQTGTSLSSSLNVSGKDPGLTAGQGGNVNVNSMSLQVLNGSAISSGTFGTGGAGNVNVSAQTVLVSGAASRIDSQTGAPPNGTLTAHAGNAGSVSVTATQFVSLLQTGAISSTADTSTGGNISIQTPSLTLAGDATISSSATFAGTITIDSGGGTVALSTGSVISTNTILSSPGGSDVAISASRINLNDSTITANTSGSGTGGNIALIGSSLQLVGGSISSSSTGSGAAGSVNLTIQNAITINHAGSIIATATNATGGDISISADSFSLTGSQSRVSTQAQNGGRIQIQTTHGDLLIQDALISAQTDAGQGGDIILDAVRGNLLINGRSVISAQANEDGNIALTAAQAVDISNSTITAKANTAGGAVIRIDPHFVLLNDSIINGRANGIDVKIQVPPAAVFLESSDSSILSDNLSLPPETDVAGALVALPQAFPQVNLGLAPVCAMRLDDNFSSFVITGQGGQPPAPSGWLPDLQNWPR